MLTQEQIEMGERLARAQEMAIETGDWGPVDDLYDTIVRLGWADAFGLEGVEEGA